MIDLHLNDDGNIAEPAEHRAERRHPDAAGSKRMVAGRIDPSVPGIHPSELGCGAPIDPPGYVSRAVERRVMAHHGDAV
jgi:hypothetical protein